MNMYEITFSPTGGTKKVAGILANELGQNITAIDLSNGSVDFYQFSLTHEDIAIIAVPSYSGRVPSIAAERMAKIQGNGAKATSRYCATGWIFGRIGHSSHSRTLNSS